MPKLASKKRQKAFQTMATLAPLPWHVTDEPGEIQDAEGRAILQVDQWGDMPDQTAREIAAGIVAAVNAVGAGAA